MIARTTFTLGAMVAAAAAYKFHEEPNQAIKRFFLDSETSPLPQRFLSELSAKANDMSCLACSAAVDSADALLRSDTV